MTITRHSPDQAIPSAIPFATTFPTTRTSAATTVVGISCRQGKRIIGDWRERDQGQGDTQDPIAGVAPEGMPGSRRWV